MDIKNEESKKTNSTKMYSNIKKMSSAKRNEHLKALIKLKQEEHIIEKTVSSHLENIKIDPKISKHIQIDYLNFANERQKMFNSLQCSVNDIRDSWNEIKSVINDLNNFGNLDIDGYKTKLHKLWEKIQEFYKNDLMDSLKEDEIILYQNLMEFNSILNRYENCDFGNSSVLTKNQNHQNSAYDFEEVENFNSLIAKTGHTQNWNNEDHLLFLKLRKKHKNISALVYAIQSKCPDLTTKCIVNHEAWYKFYLKLRDQQKSAIKDWRQQKEFERFHQIEKHEENTNKPNQSANDNRKSNRTKELIKKWKEEKENERLMHEEQKEREKQSKEYSENLRRVRAQRLKVAVTEYKERKNLETHYLKDITRECKKETIIKSPNLIMSFREQDNCYIEKRKKILSSKRDNCQKLKIDERPISTETRESTLLKYTKVWKEKCKNHINRRKYQESLYIKDLPKMSMGRQNVESL